MDQGEDGGLWIRADQCTALFSRLKGQENSLSPPERELLLRIEKLLYRRLSIQELEALGRNPG